LGAVDSIPVVSSKTVATECRVTLEGDVRTVAILPDRKIEMS